MFHLVTHRQADTKGVLHASGYSIMKNNKPFLSKKMCESLTRAKLRSIVKLLNS